MAARPAMSTGLKRSATAVAAGLLAGGVFVSAGSFSAGALSLSMGGQIPSQVPASIPGPRLAAIEAQLATIVHANQELEKFHRARA